jgi:type II secretory pathway component GspD/PulD (secretin)
LTGAGYVTGGVEFKDVGTSLKVGAVILPGNQVKVRLTPTISWLSADRSGVIEVNEASTELVVPSGRRVVLGGATTQTHELTRRILGYRASETATETTMALIATIR